MAQYKTGFESEEKIYNTAKKLFYQNGYLKTSLSEIAAASECQKSMIAYYFESKSQLALQIYNEYMEDVRHKVQEQIMKIDPNMDIDLMTALEFRVQSRNCANNQNLNRFYHELCESGVLIKSESASVNFCDEINQAHNLGFSRMDMQMLALSNLAMLHSLHVARNEGLIDCPTSYIAESCMRSMFLSLGYNNAHVEELLQKSKELVDRIKLSVEDNFEVI